MNFNEEQFRQLADETIKTVIELGTTSEIVLKRYIKFTERIIDRLEKLDLPFDRNSCLEWVDSMEHDPPSAMSASYIDWIAFRRFVILLAEQEVGALNYWKHYQSKKVEMPAHEDFVEVLSLYQKYLAKTGYKTAPKYLSSARLFLIYVANEGILNISDIQNPHVAGYFASVRFKDKSPKGIQTEASEVKRFIQYLKEEGYTTSETLQYAIPRYRVPVRRIVTTLTRQMVSDIMEDEPDSLVDMRDKAMCFLALHTGLRSGDIRNLRFNDVDWEKGIVTIQQMKTGVNLKMPMDNETHNAITDYLLYERRKCKSEYIFITAVGPAQKIARKHFRIKYRAKNSPSYNKIPHDGLHIFRRTFASRLLQCGVEVSMISNMLGHTDKNTAQKYLSTDDVKMKRCALNLSLVPYRKGDF